MRRKNFVMLLLAHESYTTNTAGFFLDYRRKLFVDDRAPVADRQTWRRQRVRLEQRLASLKDEAGENQDALADEVVPHGHQVAILMRLSAKKNAREILATAEIIICQGRR
ncbi:unnamed protein product [Amoebophrya sp. A120]|nr:unnamed protein product [Amoebophrya sp. A120]|eukprot:GSA120T00022856001.1